MNPDTKATEADIRRVCGRHDIKYVSHDRITTGFSHEVHKVNDDLILKIFNTSNDRNFKTECAVLGSHTPTLKPQLVASSDSDNPLDRPYILMTFIPGYSLGGRWHLASDEQREALIKQIVEVLRQINALSASDVGLDPIEDWSLHLEKQGKTLADKLVAKDILAQKDADKAVQVIKNAAQWLKTDNLPCVYWDIHFDNFIVDDDFKLKAIIDLENVDIVSLDYPLFVVEKQTHQPEKYLREDEEQFADIKDYVKLRGWYKQYYPEMFDFEGLEERVKVYQLLDVLHLLKDWSANAQLQTQFRELIS